MRLMANTSGHRDTRLLIDALAQRPSCGSCSALPRFPPVSQLLGQGRPGLPLMRSAHASHTLVH